MRIPAGLLTALLTLAALMPRGGEAAVGGRVLNADGVPITGATFLALERESGMQAGERRAAGRPWTPLATVTSAPDGTFQIDLKRPFARVQANADGYVPAMTADDDNAPVLVTLKRAALRRGVIIAAGRPVAGALVTWMSNDGAELQARTTANGGFEVPDPGRVPGPLVVYHADFAPRDAFVAGPADARQRQRALSDKA